MAARPLNMEIWQVSTDGIDADLATCGITLRFDSLFALVDTPPPSRYVKETMTHTPDTRHCSFPVAVMAPIANGRSTLLIQFRLL